MSLSAPAREIRGLTGIRGVAAIMVVLYHFHDTFVALVPGWSVFAPTAKVGLLGVDLFFILSGFILCNVYEADSRPVTWHSHRKFIWLRLARVYPNHVVALIAMVLVYVIARANGVVIGGLFPAGQLPLHLTMTHAWFRSPGQEWNYPSWSVSSEWFAYLFLFPLGAWWLRRKWPAMVNIVLALVLAEAWVYVSNSPLPRALFPTLRVLCGFLSGVCLYGVWRTAPWAAALCGRFATLLLVAFAINVMVLPALIARAPDLLMLLMPALLLGLASDESLAARALGSRVALYLGRISYALYMSHAVTGRVLEAALPASSFAHASLAARAGVVAVYWVALFAGASLLYHTVEEPARGWLRALGRPPRQVMPKAV